MAWLCSLIARRQFGPQIQRRPLREVLTSELGLYDMSLVCPPHPPPATLPVVQLLVFFNSGSQWCRIGQKYSSLLVIVIYLILRFRYDASTELGTVMRTEFLCISILRVTSGSRVKLVDCRNALNSLVVYTTDRSKAVVPMLLLPCVALWLILRGDLY